MSDTIRDRLSSLRCERRFYREKLRAVRLLNKYGITVPLELSDMMHEQRSVITSMEAAIIRDAAKMSDVDCVQLAMSIRKGS